MLLDNLNLAPHLKESCVVATNEDELITTLTATGKVVEFCVTLFHSENNAWRVSHPILVARIAKLYNEETLSILPPELWIHIFGFTSPKTVCEAVEVAHDLGQFGLAQMVDQLNAEKDLSEMGIRDVQGAIKCFKILERAGLISRLSCLNLVEIDIAPDQMNLLVASLPRELKKILIKDLNDEQVCLLVQRCPHLESFGCTEAFKITDSGILALLQLKNLNQVHLLNLGFKLAFDYPGLEVTDTALTQISAHPQIEALMIYGAPKVTDNGVAALHPLTKLRSLNLCNNRITDRALHEIASHQTLAELFLFNCPQLTNEGLVELGRMPHLRMLDLGHCEDLTDAGVAHLSSLTKLEHLDLGSTNITDQAFDSIRQCPLTLLILRGCKNIKGLRLSALSAAYTTLEVLDLEGCPNLSQSHLSGLTHFVSLSKLSLKDNKQITDEISTTVSKLVRLQSLDLSGTEFTDDSIADITSLEALTELNLSACFVADGGLPHIAKMSQLETLQLNDCFWLSPTGIDHLTSLVRLTTLGLSKSKVNDESLAQIAQRLHDLKELSLEKCNMITDQGLMALFPLKRLQKLNVTQASHLTAAPLLALSQRKIKVLFQ